MGQMGIIIGGIVVLLVIVWWLRRRQNPSFSGAHVQQATSSPHVQQKFPASRPRRRYWQADLATPDVCPECQQPLEQDYHTYLLAVKHQREMESFMVGSDAGYFCPTCPVVVLDAEAFWKSSQVGLGATPDAMSVAGLIDFDAIPEDKHDCVLGEDDNPIPLVEFLNLNQSPRKGPSRKRPHITRKQRKALRAQQRKKGKRGRKKP